MNHPLELGLDTFGDVTHDTHGQPVHQAQVIRDLVAQARLADETGLDFIGVGEHHRADFAVSAPEVVLAGIATATSRIRLGSAVTVLSSDDPVRVYQRFATVDALSSGRAEVILGRGSFTESFPLFGYELGDYNTLFEEKLELFAALRAEGPVTWQGTTRSALRNQRVFPVTEGQGITTWVGVGGSPESVARTARHGLHLMLAVIGGPSARFAPYVRLFRDTAAGTGHEGLRIGAHSPGHIADTDEQAMEEFWPHYQSLMSTIGRERGWTPMSVPQFRREVAEGALYVGSPETVARKIVETVRVLELSRFDLKYSNGTLPHPAMLHSIELFGTKVAPLVRDALG